MKQNLKLWAYIALLGKFSNITYKHRGCNVT